MLNHHLLQSWMLVNMPVTSLEALARELIQKANLCPPGATCGVVEVSFLLERNVSLPCLSES